MFDYEQNTVNNNKILTQYAVNNHFYFKQYK